MPQLAPLGGTILRSKLLWPPMSGTTLRLPDFKKAQ
jgi:hypothetical protein